MGGIITAILMIPENEIEADKPTETADFLPSNGAACSVWIVVGETGTYSDYSEWNVAAFATQELANHFCNLCQIEADKVNGSKDYKIGEGFKHAYDTQFAYDHTNTCYRLEMVKVFASSPPNV